jgi:hypothetical protein
MKSFDIVTLKSPALDKVLISGLVPEQKNRCLTPLFAGGGINVF